MPNSDIEGVSDLYVTGTFNGVQCKTDTHFRAQNGKGSFNWRMIWDVELPRNDTSELTFQVWDKDYFSMDDFIGEVRVKIKDEIEEALETENEVKWKDKKEFEFKVSFLKIAVFFEIVNIIISIEIYIICEF